MKREPVKWGSIPYSRTNVLTKVNTERGHLERLGRLAVKPWDFGLN